MNNMTKQVMHPHKLTLKAKQAAASIKTLKLQKALHKELCKHIQTLEQVISAGDELLASDGCTQMDAYTNQLGTTCVALQKLVDQAKSIKA